MSLDKCFCRRKEGQAPSGGCKSGARSGAGVFEFGLLLVRRFPSEYSHGNIVRTTQITFHLFLKISEGIEDQVVVETLLFCVSIRMMRMRSVRFWQK